VCRCSRSPPSSRLGLAQHASILDGVGQRPVLIRTSSLHEQRTAGGARHIVATHTAYSLTQDTDGSERAVVMDGLHGEPYRPNL